MSNINNFDSNLNNDIEINLIPDVKFDLLKTKVMRTRVTVVAILIVIITSVITAVLASVTFGVQSLMIATIDRKINEQFQTYKNYENVNQIITIQNQLSKIDNLHQNKPVASRLFNMMVSIIDGSGDSIKISKLEYDAGSRQIKLEGQSKDGFVGLERMQKAIIATNLSYQPKLKSDDINQNSNSEKSSETIGLTDKVLAIESPSYGQNAYGESVLLFYIAFQVNEKMFDLGLDLKFVAAGRKDVTDSSLVIPNNMFAASETSHKPNKKEGDK